MRMTTSAALSAATVLAFSACKPTTSAQNASLNVTENSSGAAAAATGIDGTWKTDLATLQIETRPDQMLLKAGQFSCATCTPPLTIAADGAFHAVTGRPYADQISVKVVDDRTVTRTAKKDGKVTGSSQYSVSADGNTLTVTFEDDSGTKPVKGNFTEARAAPAPAGAHSVSGSWKPQKYNNISDEGLTATFKLDGDTLHMTSPTGQSYDAKLDGTDAPIKGDIGGTIASVKMHNGAIVETDKQGGKIVGVTTMTPGTDGKLRVVSEDKRDGSSSRFTMTKQ